MKKPTSVDLNMPKAVAPSHFLKSTCIAGVSFILGARKTGIETGCKLDTQIDQFVFVPLKLE